MRPSRVLLVMSLAMLLVLCSASGAQTLTVVRSFSGASGPQFPDQGALVQGRDGNLYGMSAGPLYGSAYRINTNGRDSEVSVFNGTNASFPSFGLTLATDGRFYGGTNFGGSLNYGVIFRVTASGIFDSLHDFQGGADGSRPLSPPIEASDGNFYGPTFGDLFPSTVYKYDTSGTFSTIYTFAAPYANDAGLIQASDGNLYGVTQLGGSNGTGTLFKLTTSGALLASYEFTCGNDGGYPAATLVEGPDGALYGTTSICGAGEGGTIFKYDQQGRLTTLHSFYPRGSGGIRPNPFGLVLATDGKLYGTTFAGGKLGLGSVFQIETNGTNYKELASLGSSTGEFPGGLMQHTNGLFYGGAYGGGLYGYGTVYGLNMGLGPFVTFVQPTGKAGNSAQILGQGLTGTTSVTFNGIPATSFRVGADTFMTAVVPSGAATGKVVVTTPSGTLTSNVNFRITN